MQRIEYNDYSRSISVAAWVSAYAYDPANDTLHFASLGGVAGSVNALLSALVSNLGHSVEIQAGEEHLILSAPRWRRLQTLTARLPSGSSHGLLLTGGGDNDQEILILNATPEVIFRHLYDSHPITALPQWGAWLAKELEERKLLHYLTGYNLTAALLKVDEEKLDEMVSQGIRKQKIRFRD